MMKLFKNKLILAPMAGITDTIFRRICKKNGADVVVSEMVSAEGLFHSAKNCSELISFDISERPIGIQLFGSNPHSLVYAAKYIEQNYNPDFIDLNAGCPAPKVIKKNGGAALLKNQKLFEGIVSSMVKSVSIPVTVKIRSGWTKYEWVDLDFARIAEQCGAAAITVHPRFKTMLFSGHSFWDRIAMVKELVSIPVIGNGDIIKPEDGMAMFLQTGCDSIMIGRATYGNPWIFRQIKDILENKPPTNVSEEDICATVLSHLQEYRKIFSDYRAAKEMKKHCAWYLRGKPGAASVRDTIFRSDRVEQIQDAITGFFKCC